MEHLKRQKALLLVEILKTSDKKIKNEIKREIERVDRELCSFVEVVKNLQ